jgi:hypothetical protein
MFPVRGTTYAPDDQDLCFHWADFQIEAELGRRALGWHEVVDRKSKERSDAERKHSGFAFAYQCRGRAREKAFEFCFGALRNSLWVRA